MAKKRKKNNNSDKAVTFSTGGELSYLGNVTIQYERGGKAIKSHALHNEGCLPLFRFIGSCLIESFNVNLAPYGVRLFQYEKLAADTPENNIFNAEGGAVEITTTIIPKTDVVIETVNKSDDKHVTAAISFLVPFSTLPEGSSANVMAIYNREKADSIYEPSAFLRITDSNKTITGDGKSNIRITWKMTISNGKEVQ